MRKAPFSSSFFNIDFTADRLYWNLKTDTVTMYIMGSSKVAPLVIESQDFYDPEGYRELRGQGFPFHPLALVVIGGLLDSTLMDQIVTPAVFYKFGRNVYRKDMGKMARLDAPWDDAWMRDGASRNGAVQPPAEAKAAETA